ncbi:myosin-2 [Neocallimastix californiae]|uniref:Myosin-2 n=1 Tax=Neocallimastix californiae TaxID=1754190 RepID=A0A1Y2CMV3_9FUNG|nr:myosin-2 [Neocallimastix californiae]|eukprot:ORY48368.1 myosin-2 [Neocallimastix californiae]
MEAIDKQLTFYNKGTRAWIQDDVEGFVSGTVVSNDISGNSCTLVFEVEGRDEPFSVTITKGDTDVSEKLPPLRNPPVLEGVDDLTLLSHLNEPEVLHNVRLRYSQEQIYTYSGIVLIALNPFQRLPIYTHDIMRAYSGKRRGELEPHLFAVAEEAYRNMLREKKNQSIIVSGESGAGKTQSAKYIMRYFASVDELDQPFDGDADINDGGMSEVEEAVLATNPIMEAFGNAKTTRNDNSSRFGKYIEIQFHKDDTTGRVKICGAKTRTYLLERSRLVFQPKTERNYHIFYQLCSGCPAAERKELGITTFDQYHYLRQGGEGTIPNVDDVEEFEITQRALSAIGISVNMQWAIFKVCAALLHIGNIEVKESRNGDAQINSSDEALEIASRLLGVKPMEFSKWMVKKRIHARSETIDTNLKKYDAIVSRDSVAKFIYSLLFDWLVKMINNNLAVDETKYNSDSISFIGVLDIYGFEHFKNNSFEQFCINYANEKLQQEFNRHVFKLEQDEYVAEKIEWSFIDFNDNQPCIDMIENRLGILALLDEESRLPSGSDESLISKLYQNFDKKECKFFKKPRFARSDFTIVHYAIDVTYQIEGFIEKNKDTVSDELLNLLQNSESEFIRELTTPPKPKEDTPPPQPKPGFRSKAKNTKSTLGSIFKASLIELMNTIRSTESHYIRCIKPNQAKVAFEFEPQMVLSQLRACGVLETIRISCAGYPTRWTFPEFVERYYLLVPSKHWKFDDPREFSLNIVKLLIDDKDKYQVGETKIFFRAGMLAYFEKLRTERLRQCIVLVQKNARRFVYQRRYNETKKAALFVQNAIRRKVAQLKCREIRETQAAITIQRYTRGFLAKKHYQQQRESAIAIQTQIRGYMARKQLNHLRRERAAIKIQKVFRGQRERHRYQEARRNIIFVQSCIRRIAAVKVFTQLKIEAKSITHIKKLNYQLENKVFELSQSLAQKENETKEYQQKIETMESQIKIWKEKFDRLDTRYKDSTEQATEGSAEQLREISELKDAKSNLESTIEKMKTENKKAIAERDSRIAELEEQLEKQKEENKSQRNEINSRRGQADDNSALVAQLKRENASLKDQLQKVLSGKDYLYDADERVGRSSSVSRVRGRSSNRNRSRIPSVDTRTTMLNVVDRPIRQLSKVRTESETPAKTDASAAAAPVDQVKEPEAQSLEDECSLKILEDESLEQEIIDGLIMNLKIPLPNSTQKIERKDILFPAHIIGTCMLKLMKHGLLARLQTLSSKVIAAIQNVALRFEDDYISCFWLSNTYELSCVVETIRTKEASRSRSRYRMENDGNKVLIKILNDLDNLLVRLYYGWMKELKKRLAVMAVPAIIEYQALPSFICKKNGGLWNKIKAPQNSYTIDHLLFLLSKISKVLICFYVEESIARQILCELIRLLGVTAFNHLIMRKNFCTWKRGMQIQYNLSKLEEWCDEHQIPEGALHLERLLQAAKLLQLNKSSPRDIEIIFDICFLLNPSQIKKFLSLYYPVDFENPVSPELLKSVSFRSISENNDTLLLDMDDVEFDKPPLRTVDKIDTSAIVKWKCRRLIHSKACV